MSSSSSNSEAESSRASEVTDGGAEGSSEACMLCKITSGGAEGSSEACVLCKIEGTSGQGAEGTCNKADAPCLFDISTGHEISEYLHENVLFELKSFLETEDDTELALYYAFLSTDESLKDPDNLIKLNAKCRQEKLDQLRKWEAILIKKKDQVDAFLRKQMGVPDNQTSVAGSSKEENTENLAEGSQSSSGTTSVQDSNAVGLSENSNVDNLSNVAGSSKKLDVAGPSLEFDSSTEAEMWAALKEEFLLDEDSEEEEDNRMINGLGKQFAEWCDDNDMTPEEVDEVHKGLLALLSSVKSAFKNLLEARQANERQIKDYDAECAEIASKIEEEIKRTIAAKKEQLNAAQKVEHKKAQYIALATIISRIPDRKQMQERLAVLGAEINKLYAEAASLAEELDKRRKILASFFYDAEEMNENLKTKEGESDSSDSD